MCLSRLQDKFKMASKGERLFRAVRNRGYCLIQEVVA
jgi:DNA-binding winged helix-turn-helix (wHTH) protein